MIATATPDPIASNTRLTYELTVSNEGDDPLTGVRLEIRHGPGLQVFNAPCDPDGGTLDPS